MPLSNKEKIKAILSKHSRVVGMAGVWVRIIRLEDFNAIAEEIASTLPTPETKHKPDKCYRLGMKPEKPASRETNLDLAKYGLILNRGASGEVEFYARTFRDATVEVMVSADVFSISLFDGGKETIIINRQKVTTQDQLDFLLLNGRVKGYFSQPVSGASLTIGAPLKPDL